MSRVRRPRVAGLTVTANVVGTLAVALALTACSGDDSSVARPTVSPSEASDPTASLTDLDTAALVVRRAPFCDAIGEEAVAAALGQQAGEASAYRSGQRTKVSEDVTDVVHEFGCRWSAGQNTAEAWVFAPPVTRERAQQLAAQARERRGCAVDAPSPPFGAPDVWCVTPRPQGVRAVRAQGLFGDAWLSCSLSLARTPDREVRERASGWCAAVATAASAGG